MLGIPSDWVKTGGKVSSISNCDPKKQTATGLKVMIIIVSPPKGAVRQTVDPRAHRITEKTTDWPQKNGSRKPTKQERTHAKDFFSSYAIPLGLNNIALPSPPENIKKPSNMIFGPSNMIFGPNVRKTPTGHKPTLGGLSRHIEVALKDVTGRGRTAKWWLYGDGFAAPYGIVTETGNKALLKRRGQKDDSPYRPNVFDYNIDPKQQINLTMPPKPPKNK